MHVSTLEKETLKNIHKKWSSFSKQYWNVRIEIKNAPTLIKEILDCKFVLGKESGCSYSYKLWFQQQLIK